MGLRFPSIETFEAANGEEAMREIEANQPAAVFMDLRLGGENGLDLTKKIKAKYPDLVVVILTNYDLPEYREAAYRSGADHFISKDSFLSMVNSILTYENIRATHPNRRGPGERPTMAHSQPVGQDGTRGRKE